LLVFEYWTLHGQGSDGQQLQCRCWDRLPYRLAEGSTAQQTKSRL
jgi:hypothetical protein